MPEAIVTIAELLPKKSEKAPYQAKDSNGTYWKCWDEPFALGQFKFDYYEKTREWEGKTYTDNIVKSQQLQNGAAPTPLPSSQREDGTADWDIVGLRQTRCAIWKHVLQETIPVAAAWWSKSHTDASEADLLMFLGRVASHMAVKAEVDIYHRAPAVPGEEVPF